MVEEAHLIGKTVKGINVDGFGVDITFTDGTVFYYNASDEGCSDWDIIEPMQNTRLVNAEEEA